VTLQNNLRGASWSVAPLESHNVSNLIMDVMTHFRIHYFPLVVRLVGTKKILYADQGDLIEGLCVSL
jgi:hypothetical protein